MKKKLAMADNHSKESRSYNMSRIKAKNTTPEIIVRKFLFHKGFRFRIHVQNLPGKPDIILPKYKTVIFVNGCFWHGHTNCRYFIIPKTRTDWWKNKILRTKSRDIIEHKILKDMGFKVLIIWECQLKKNIATQTLNALEALLHRRLIELYQ